MTANPAHKPGRIREMSEAECREMITTTTVGRIAFVDDDGQQLIPVNFAFIDEAIYFRTLSDGFPAQLARKQSEVAFGVDHHDDTYRLGWNVTVKGIVEQIEDRATINKVLSHSRLAPWAGGVRPMVMRVSPSSIQGRRVVGH